MNILRRGPLTKEEFFGRYGEFFHSSFNGGFRELSRDPKRDVDGEKEATDGDGVPRLTNHELDRSPIGMNETSARRDNEPSAIRRGYFKGFDFIGGHIDPTDIRAREAANPFGIDAESIGGGASF